MINYREIEAAVEAAKAESGMYRPHSVRVMTRRVRGDSWTNLYDVSSPSGRITAHQMELLVAVTAHNAALCEGELTIEVSLQQGGRHFCTAE